MTDAWDEESLYFDGDQYFAELISAINSAKAIIHFETYIFDIDFIGREIETALKSAVRRGVDVRLLVDGIGARAWIEKRSFELERAGVQIRVYHPVAIFDWLKLSRLNRRTHRKMCVVDKKIAFIGSLNVSASHSERAKGPAAWRDTAVRVSGQPVRDFIAAFEHAWVRSHTRSGERHWMDSILAPRLIRPRSPLVRLNYTSRLRRRLSREFLTRLRLAKHRIWITNAYLAPPGPVLRRLRRAAQAGIDVRVLVPRQSDVFFMPWVAIAHYAPLMLAGVRIYEYLPRFLHAKSVIIDDWAAVGSSNLNRRSVLHDLEVDVVLSSPHSLTALEDQFKHDLTEAEEVSSPPGGFVARLGRLIIYFFRRWI